MCPCAAASCSAPARAHSSSQSQTTATPVQTPRTHLGCRGPEEGRGLISCYGTVQPDLGPSHTHLDVPLQVLLERRLLDSLSQLVVDLQLCRQPLYLPLQARRRITPSALTHLPTIPCSGVPTLCVTLRASSAAWNLSVSSVCSCCRLLCSSADKHARSGADAKCLRRAGWFSRNTHVATFYVPLVLLCSSFTLLFVQHVQVGRRLRFHLENPVK